MRYLFLILLLTLCSLNINGQIADQHLTFTIIDDATLEPCAFAHIGVVRSDQGAISDENGRVLIALNKDYDSIYIQMLGYDTRVISIHDIGEVIRLKRVILPLQEVTITANQKTQKVGGTKPRKKAIPWTSRDMLGTEIGTYFNQLPEDKAIDAVNVFLRRNHCDSILFRLRFYKAKDDNIRASQIEHEDYTFKIGSDKKWVRIQLDDLLIKTTPKMLVTIEALHSWGNNSNKPDFALSHDKRHTGHAASRRYSRKDGWTAYTYAGKGLSINLDIVE